MTDSNSRAPAQLSGHLDDAAARTLIDARRHSSPAFNRAVGKLRLAGYTQRDIANAMAACPALINPVHLAIERPRPPERHLRQCVLSLAERQP